MGGLIPAPASQRPDRLPRPRTERGAEGLITACGALALQVAPGADLPLVVVTLRPRLGRLPKDTVTLDRAAAPALFSLVDRVAAATGTRPADLVALDAATVMPGHSAGLSSGPSRA